MILSGESRLIGQFLINPVSVGIGLISYSLYLVHWPVLVFYEYYTFEPLTGNEQIALFILTFLLATLMYFFVEKPFRKNAPSHTNRSPQKVFVLASLGAMTMVGLVGFQIDKSSGWAWRQPGSLTASAISEGMSRRYDLIRKGCNLMRLDDPDFCSLDRPDQVLVLGNSHEPDGYNAFAAIYGNNPSVNLISFGTINLCDIQFGDSGPFSTVKDRNCASRVAMLNDVGFISSLNVLIYSANQPFAGNKTVF